MAKDRWDKISAITPLIRGFAITGIGVIFSNVYNNSQLQLNQILALEKFYPQLTSNNPIDREFAYSAFTTLGYEDMAVRIIQLNADSSAQRILSELKRSGSSETKQTAAEVLDEINKDTIIESSILSSKIPVIVMFDAKWCRPCDITRTSLELFADTHNDKISIIIIDIDVNRYFSTKYGVRGIPTIMIFNDGELKDTRVGALSETLLAEWIEGVANIH